LLVFGGKTTFARCGTISTAFATGCACTLTGEQLKPVPFAFSHE
jgi:hypothetical protein